MKMRLVAAALSTALASSSFASLMSSHVGHYYVSPSLGLYTVNNPDHPVDRNGPAFDLTAGYQLSKQFAVQAAATMVDPNRTAWITRVEGVASVPTHSHFVPSMIVGVGAMNLDSGTNALADVGLGVKYFFGANTSADFNYRHFYQVGGKHQNTDMYSVGFTYMFGMDGHHYVSQLTPSQHKMLKQAKHTLRHILPQGVEQCGKHGATAQQGCVTFNGNDMTMHLDVKFAMSRAKIKQKYASAINRVTDFMQQYPQTTAQLKGYASILAGPHNNYDNMALSKRRAQSVKRYLVNHGIAAHRLSVVAMGTKNPVNTQCSMSNRQACYANQRVEAAIPVPLKH